jgi:FMN phosphatase YigB (HAD superfamily)
MIANPRMSGDDFATSATTYSAVPESRILQSDPRIMPLRGILFDMGDIFYDATPWRRTITAALAERGIAIEFAEFVRRWEAELVPVYLGKKPYWDAFGDLLATFALDELQREEIIGIANDKARAVEQRTLFPGVAATLAELHRRGIKLAVLSDTESRESKVRERLAAMGIERYFDGVLTSADLGYVKPMQEAFAAVLVRIDVEKEDAAFVAHDEDELTGAREFGLLTIAYNYAPGVAADHYLSDFSSLLELAPAIESR